ncbi:response regulator transcription factor [Vallitalea okinawensis]|uniref:response regulator transcription factor n=1 Tax=Vallitalea okinawensis TaxID=2078660 RepID=UPI000CFD06A0|nr:response regulator [Vallitalea okinawensis]
MKLMIVDDNKMFRYAFMQTLDWKEQGIQLIFEAMNGLHALELLEDQVVDIVVTDMSMPEMDGVELIKVIKEKYPTIKILALSNFDDFTFVKEALKLGAEDYLLKHEMTPTTLLEAIEECKKLVISDSSHKESVNMQHKYLEIDSFTGKMLHGQLGVEEMQIGLYMYTTHKYIKNVILITIELIGSNHDQYTYREWLQKNINDNYLILKANITKTTHAIILNYHHVSSEQKIMSHMREFVNRLSTASKTVDFETTIAVSGIGRGLKSIPILYAQVQLTRDAMIYSNRSVLFYDPSMRTLADISEPSSLIGNMVYQESMMKDQPNFIQEISKIFNKIKDNPIDRLSLDKVMFEMSTIILRLAKIHDVNIFDVIGDNKNLYSLMCEKNCIKDKEAIMSQIIDQIYNKASNYNNILNTDVREIMKYVDENYCSDLNLASIAEVFSFNANYLSSLFKQETGMNMTDYIKTVRVRHAKAFILERKYKTYEIAKMSGFKNTSYFCTVFKEVTSMSPKEFKDNN